MAAFLPAYTYPRCCYSALVLSSADCEGSTNLKQTVNFFSNSQPIDFKVFETMYNRMILFWNCSFLKLIDKDNENIQTIFA